MKTTNASSPSRKTLKKPPATTAKSSSKPPLGMLCSSAAGIDIASREHWVCVPENRATPNVRKFGTFTCDLYAIAAWLQECGVTTVAMESTGVYWIPLFQVLEARGFTVCLVNAKHLKNVSNRPKSDRLDCQWLQRLHAYGLLMASFRPPEQLCHLRTLLRHRDAIIRASARHVQHMQKALHQMNLMLDTVITDITGVTGQQIIQAILAGERNPTVLAGYRDYRVRASEERIAKALEGTYQEEHVFVLQHAYAAYQFARQQIAACDQAVERALKRLDKTLDATQTPLPPSPTAPRIPPHNAPTYDARTYVYEVYGVDLTQVPGFQASTIQTLLAEVGCDMNKWPTDKHFTSWLGLAPNVNRSGGKDKSASTRKVNSRAALALRQAARAAGRSHSYLGAYYRRLRARCGPPKAITATARKLAVIFYYMVKRGAEYQELGEEYYLKRSAQRQVRRLKQQARRLGFQVSPLPPDAHDTKTQKCAHEGGTRVTKTPSAP